jgi:hypothetical protein
MKHLARDILDETFERKCSDETFERKCSDETFRGISKRS